MLSGSGASASGAFNQSQQMHSATPPPQQPVVGLAQAQANNSNNKTGTSMSPSENNLPEDLQVLMDDWAQEVLIVTHRPRTDSLSIRGQQLCPQVVPQTLEQPHQALNVGLKKKKACMYLQNEHREFLLFLLLFIFPSFPDITVDSTRSTGLCFILA